MKAITNSSAASSPLAAPICSQVRSRSFIRATTYGRAAPRASRRLHEIQSGGLSRPSPPVLPRLLKQWSMPALLDGTSMAHRCENRGTKSGLKWPFLGWIARILALGARTQWSA